jgi:hypothetical protein
VSSILLEVKSQDTTEALFLEQQPKAVRYCWLKAVYLLRQFHLWSP